MLALLGSETLLSFCIVVILSLRLRIALMYVDPLWAGEVDKVKDCGEAEIHRILLLVGVIVRLAHSFDEKAVDSVASGTLVVHISLSVTAIHLAELDQVHTLEVVLYDHLVQVPDHEFFPLKNLVLQNLLGYLQLPAKARFSAGNFLKAGRRFGHCRSRNRSI